LHGTQLRYENGGGKDNIGYWVNPDEWAEWPFKVTAPGAFQVTAEIAAMGAGQFEVSLANQTLRGTAPVTGDYARFQTVDLGSVNLYSTGKAILSVKPVKSGWSPINLKVIRLQPAKP